MVQYVVPQIPDGLKYAMIVLAVILLVIYTVVLGLIWYLGEVRSLPQWVQLAPLCSEGSAWSLMIELVRTCCLLRYPK